MTLIATDPLAYVTAKVNGLTEECEAILEATGLTEEQIKLPALGQPLSIPRPVAPTYKANWPRRPTSQSYFEKVLLGQVESTDEAPSREIPNGFGFDDDKVDEATTGLGDVADEVDVGDEWDMGEDLNIEEAAEEDEADSQDRASGATEAELWARNSPLAADHVAAGSFESAMQLLNRQIGAINFAPLKPRFLEVYQATKTYLQANPGLPPLVNYVRRTTEETSPRKILPIISRTLDHITSDELQRGFKCMSAAKVVEGVEIFRGILWALMLSAVEDRKEFDEVSGISHHDYEFQS